MPNHFNPTYISVTTECTLPPHIAHAERVAPNGILVKVDSICMGQAFNLCSDILTALEYGAVPEAHLLMIDRVTRAEEKGFPLSCSLEFCA